MSTLGVFALEAYNLRPPILDLASIDLNGLNVKALLDREQAGGEIDLRSEEFLCGSEAGEGDKDELASEFRLLGAQLTLAAYEVLILFTRDADDEDFEALAVPEEGDEKPAKKPPPDAALPAVASQTQKE